MNTREDPILPERWHVHGATEDGPHLAYARAAGSPRRGTAALGSANRGTATLDRETTASEHHGEQGQEESEQERDGETSASREVPGTSEGSMADAGQGYPPGQRGVDYSRSGPRPTPPQASTAVPGSREASATPKVFGAELVQKYKAGYVFRVQESPNAEDTWSGISSEIFGHFCSTGYQLSRNNHTRLKRRKSDKSGGGPLRLSVVKYECTAGGKPRSKPKSKEAQYRRQCSSKKIGCPFHITVSWNIQGGLPTIANASVMTHSHEPPKDTRPKQMTSEEVKAQEESIKDFGKSNFSVASMCAFLEKDGGILGRDGRHQVANMVATIRGKRQGLQENNSLAFPKLLNPPRRGEIRVPPGHLLPTETQSKFEIGQAHPHSPRSPPGPFSCPTPRTHPTMTTREDPILSKRWHVHGATEDGPYLAYARAAGSPRRGTAPLGSANRGTATLDREPTASEYHGEQGQQEPEQERDGETSACREVPGTSEGSMDDAGQGYPPGQRGEELVAKGKAAVKQTIYADWLALGKECAQQASVSDLALEANQRVMSQMKAIFELALKSEQKTDKRASSTSTVTFLGTRKATDESPTARGGTSDARRGVGRRAAVAGRDRRSRVAAVGGGALDWTTERRLIPEVRAHVKL